MDGDESATKFNINTNKPYIMGSGHTVLLGYVDWQPKYRKRKKYEYVVTSYHNADVEI